MAETKFKVVNAKLNGYVHRVLRNLPVEKRKFFDTNEIKLITNHIKHFLQRGSLEDKLYMLAKAGKHFVITIVDDKVKEFSEEKLARILTVYKRKADSFPRETFNDQVILFFTDLDLVRSKLLMNESVNNHVTLQNMMQLSKTYKQMDEFRQENEEVMNELRTARSIDKFILQVMEAHEDRELFQEMFDINMNEYCVLASVSRKNMMSIHELQKNIFLSNVGRITSKLRDKNMLIELDVSGKAFQNTKQRTMFYQLSGFGEIVLTRARKYLLEGTFKF